MSFTGKAVGVGLFLNIVGVYALAAQVKPDITPDEFWDLAFQTGQTIELSHAGANIPFGPIINLPVLIANLQK